MQRRLDQPFPLSVCLLTPGRSTRAHLVRFLFFPSPITYSIFQPALIFIRRSVSSALPRRRSIHGRLFHARVAATCPSPCFVRVPPRAATPSVSSSSPGQARAPFRPADRPQGTSRSPRNSLRAPWEHWPITNHEPAALALWSEHLSLLCPLCWQVYFLLRHLHALDAGHCTVAVGSVNRMQVPALL